LKSTRTVRVLVLGAAVAVGAAAAGLAYAQPAHGGRGHRVIEGRGGPGGPGIPFRQLDLTEDQRTQMKQIADQQKAGLQAAGEKVRAARKALHDVETTVPFDEATVRARFSEVSAAEAEVVVLRGRLHAQMFQVLTPDQQTKAQQLKAQREQRMAERSQRVRERRDQRLQQRQQQQQQPPQGAPAPREL